MTLNSSVPKRCSATSATGCCAWTSLSCMKMLQRWRPGPWDRCEKQQIRDDNQQKPMVTCRYIYICIRCFIIVDTSWLKLSWLYQTSNSCWVYGRCLCARWATNRVAQAVLGAGQKGPKAWSKQYTELSTPWANTGKPERIVASNSTGGRISCSYLTLVKNFVRKNDTRWCPRSIAKLVNITPITMVYRWYIFSIHGLITNLQLGAPPCSEQKKSVTSSFGIWMIIPSQLQQLWFI